MGTSYVELPESEINNSSPFIAKVKNGGPIPPLPHMYHGMVLN
jgi:hypothetical protein